VSKTPYLDAIRSGDTAAATAILTTSLAARGIIPGARCWFRVDEHGSTVRAVYLGPADPEWIGAPHYCHMPRFHVRIDAEEGAPWYQHNGKTFTTDVGGIAA
jgi:hypothetical protein